MKGATEAPTPSGPVAVGPRWEVAAPTAAFVRRWLPRRRSRILDVGCGTGEVAALLAPHHEVLGIDVSAEAVARTRALGVDARVADVRSLEEVQFDLVLFCRSLHHVERPAAALRRVGRLLAPGGCLLVEELADDEAGRAEASWHARLVALLEGGGRVGEADDLQHWRREAHTLPTGEVERLLRQHFEILGRSRGPRLHRGAVDLLQADTSSARALATFRWVEQRHIDAGILRPLGVRWIAGHPAPRSPT